MPLRFSPVRATGFMVDVYETDADNNNVILAELNLFGAASLRRDLFAPAHLGLVAHTVPEHLREGLRQPAEDMGTTSQATLRGSWLRPSD